MKRDLRAALGCAALTTVLALSASAVGQEQDGHDHDAQTADPHGAAPHGAAPDGPPRDGAVADPALPHGSIAVMVADPAGKPLPGTEVTLGVLVSSVAQGDRSSRLRATTDATGRARFDGVETGLTVAYRVTVLKDGATFAVPPFQMPTNSGMRAMLHVYPVVHDVEQALVVSQVMLVSEVKDDRIQIQEAFRIYNFGRTAWVADDLLLKLPEDFTGFAAQQGMNDISVTSVPKKGVAVRGTFPPGQHVVEFRWQLPYKGSSEVRFEAGMPPHLAAAQVIAPASRDMTLEAAGFPAPQPQNDGQGQRMLVTQKQLRREDPPLASVSVTLRGLPTEGPGRFIATLLALGGITAGLVLGTRKPQAHDRKAERQKLLDELEALERAHRDGSVGPKTYERGRREILDALARTFVTETALGAGTDETLPPGAAKARKRRKAS